MSASDTAVREPTLDLEREYAAVCALAEQGDAAAAARLDELEQQLEASRRADARRRAAEAGRRQAAELAERQRREAQEHAEQARIRALRDEHVRLLQERQVAMARIEEHLAALVADFEQAKADALKLDAVASPLGLMPPDGPHSVITVRDLAERTRYVLTEVLLRLAPMAGAMFGPTYGQGAHPLG